MDSTYPASAPPRPERVASARHTMIFVAILLAIAVLGARSHAPATATPSATRPNALTVYLPIAFAEWMLVFFIWRGVKARGGSLHDLVGGSWNSAGDMLRDIALGALVWGGWTVIAAAWAWWTPNTVGQSIQTLLPRGAAEIVVWIALSCSAGIAEEIAFRGYLLRQAKAFSGSAGIAVVAQAIAFAAAHSYQGVLACAKIAVYGVLFGVVAVWRRSLRPGMIAHAWTDIAAGIFRI